MIMGTVMYPSSRTSHQFSLQRPNQSQLQMLHAPWLDCQTRPISRHLHHTRSQQGNHPPCLWWRCQRVVGCLCLVCERRGRGKVLIATGLIASDNLCWLMCGHVPRGLTWTDHAFVLAGEGLINVFLIHHSIWFKFTRFHTYCVATRSDG